MSPERGEMFYRISSADWMVHNSQTGIAKLSVKFAEMSASSYRTASGEQLNHTQYFPLPASSGIKYREREREMNRSI
jgi:hypothetical protein